MVSKTEIEQGRFLNMKSMLAQKSRVGINRRKRLKTAERGRHKDGHGDGHSGRLGRCSPME